MADYTVTFAPPPGKELEQLSNPTAVRILEKVEALSQNPRPPGRIKLRGQRNLWRLRVGDYRMVYAINDAAGTVDVSIVRHRREVYRDL